MIDSEIIKRITQPLISWCTFSILSVTTVLVRKKHCRFLLQPDADCFNPLNFTTAVLQKHEREVKGGVGRKSRKRPSNKHLTPAPQRCGLNVACLLRAGFGNRGLSGPSPLQEPLRDCHGMEPMHQELALVKRLAVRHTKEHGLVASLPPPLIRIPRRVKLGKGRTKMSRSDLLVASVTLHVETSCLQIGDSRWPKPNKSSHSLLKTKTKKSAFFFFFLL